MQENCPSSRTLVSCEIASRWGVATTIPSARYRLNTLGHLGLRRGDGADVGAVLQQPKRLVLLAYLALVDPPGPQSRDSLLALFWPELPEKRARNALNKSLHFLRSEIGHEVIRSHGALEVGLADGALWCDASAFERALDEERVEEALALYAGTFLEGVHVSEAPELEHWVERRRERLARRYARALEGMAARVASGGDVAAAANWWRRLTEHDPYHAGAVVGLMEALEAIGKRGAALREAERHAALLREELDAAPEPEVTLLAERLRRSPQPVDTRVAPRDNLPHPPTEILGRKSEIERIARILEDPAIRLVSLTGPGGVGKTRLALEVARKSSTRFPDGVHFVDLGTLADAGLVGVTIARTAGIAIEADRDEDDALREGLEGRRCLLVLDGFEPVLEAARRISDLLEATEGPRFLVTSRAILQLRGERVFPVPPLALPDSRSVANEEELLRFGAVELFVARARAADPAFRLTRENGEAVTAICAGLDGLPLAIELAAARVRTLDPRAILARLSDRFDLLRSGPRDLPERQQTLRRTFDWSYDLLSEPQRGLFRRLCVFVGGCTLEAIHAVCNAETPGKTPVLDDLTALVDNSLIRQVSDAEGTPRFTMLDSVRAYGRRLLEDAGELDTLQRAHAMYFLNLAERAEPRLSGRDQVIWMDRLEQDFANLQAVLDWALGQGEGEVELAVRIGSRLWSFLWLRGHFTEMRWRLDRALDRRGALSPSLQANLLIARGAVESLDGDHERALGLYEEVLGLDRSRLSRAQIAQVQRSMAFALSRRGEYEGSIDLLEQALAASRESGEVSEVTSALRGLAKMALHIRDYGRAERLYEEALDLGREGGDRHALAWTLHGLSEIARHTGDMARAATLLDEGLEICRELDSKPGYAYLRLASAHVARYQGNLEGARRRYEEALVLLSELGNRRRVALCLLGLAALDMREGHLERALTLIGAVDPVSEVGGIRLAPVDQAEYERAVEHIRGCMDEAEIARLRRRGRAMEPNAVLELALSGGAAPAGPIRVEVGPGGSSPR